MKIVLLKDVKTGETFRVEEQHLVDIAYYFFCQSKWTEYERFGVDLKTDDVFEPECHECELVEVYEGDDNIPTESIACIRLYRWNPFL